MYVGAHTIEQRHIIAYHVEYYVLRIDFDVRSQESRTECTMPLAEASQILEV